MSFEDAKPLEVNDFSGGITEMILQEDPRRSATLDNLQILTAKNIETRPPFSIMPGASSQLPTGDQRVTSMFSWVNETLLVSQSERQFFYYDNELINWTEIPGISGNPILSGADVNAQTSYSEFQKQIYLTSDGGIDSQGSLPVKIYQNNSGVWKGVTAGLPRAYSTPTYTDTSLFVDCKNLALSLQNSMISHYLSSIGGFVDKTVIISTFPVYVPAFLPFAGVFVTNRLHANIDMYAYAYISGVSNTQLFSPSSIPFIPDPIPDGTIINALSAPNADAEDLYDAVEVLTKSYTVHLNDALIGSYNQDSSATNTATPLYHYPIQPIVDLPPVKGPLVPLNTTIRPTSLSSAAAQLNDLRMKWNFHRLSINTHSKMNTFSDIDKFPVASPEIGQVNLENSPPTMTPNYAGFFEYINNLKKLYLGHIGINGPHSQPPTGMLEDGSGYQRFTGINYPDCDSLESMYALIYWLRAQYFVHYLDASTSKFTNITFTSTSPSPTLGAVVGITFTPPDTPEKYWVYSPVASPIFAFPAVFGSNVTWPTPITSTVVTTVAQVITSAFGMDRNLNTTAGNTGQISRSWYHVANSAGTLTTVVNPQTTSAEGLASGAAQVGADITSWLTLAEEFFNALGTHAFNSNIHAIYNGVPTATNNTTGIQFVTVGTIYPPEDTWKNYSLNAASDFFIPQVSSQSYALVFKHEYTVGINGLEYIVRSNPVFTDLIDAPISYPENYVIPTTNSNLYPNATNPATYSTVLTNLPTLVNAPDTNYDLTNVKLEIYRTANAGTTYYLEGTVDLGTNSFTDTANDTLEVGSIGPLTDQPQLYTTGDVLGSDQPPKCKFTHILNDTIYYGAIFDSGQFFANRILQGVQSAPDWAPAGNTDDLDDKLVGLGSAKNNVIAFCKNSLYRMQGGFSSTGQGSLTHEKISDVLGCVNTKSIVQTEVGVFFAGTDGFYYTDGFQNIKISLELDRTYAGLTASDEQKRNIYGCYDKVNRRVWWAMKTSPTDSDNSVFFIFYLNFGVKPSGVFTTASNFPYQRPSSCVFQQGVLYYGHENGYVLYGDVFNKDDSKIDVTLSPASWQRCHIPWEYKSVAINFGTIFKRKFFTKIHLLGDNVGNQAIQPTIIRDLNSDGDGIKDMKAINYADNPTWGTPICMWGDPTQIWGVRGKLDVWRRFPQTSLRADFMQVSLTPADLIVYASSVGFPFGANASVDSTLKTATIITPTGYTAIVWPLDVVGYSIAFDIDGYVNEYLVTALDVTHTIITYSDAANTSINAPLGVKWQISGVKKEQRFTMTSFVAHFVYLGDKNQRYPGDFSNAGPGNGGANPP